MNILKKGFTVTELLIAMTIIGVVSAVTIPQVVQTTLKNQAGQILAKTVEQIETGCQNLIQKANDNITMDQGGYFEGLTSITTKHVFGDDEAKNLSGPDLFKYGGVFFGLTPLDNVETYFNSIKNFTGDGISAGTGFKTIGKAYILKDQKSVIFTDNEDNEKNNIDEFNTAVFIDVNGVDKPNRGGKDIFIFGLTHGGKLIPRGSKSYQKYASGAPLHTEDCADNNVKTGWSCAGRVVKDGYKIKYY